MKTIRVAAVCAFVALVAVQSWAQDKPTTSQAAQSAQDVGGVADTTGDAGRAKASMQQPRDEFGNSAQAAEQRRVSSSLFSHH